jgi:hypothetical protein
MHFFIMPIKDAFFSRTHQVRYFLLRSKTYRTGWIEGSLAGKISYGRICISGFELLTWYGFLHFSKTILVVVDSVPAHGEAYMLTCQS